eukprot:9140785-Pyramimonas_sp.AAC.1
MHLSISWGLSWLLAGWGSLLAPLPLGLGPPPHFVGLLPALAEVAGRLSEELADLLLELRREARLQRQERLFLAL